MDLLAVKGGKVVMEIDLKGRGRRGGPESEEILGVMCDTIFFCLKLNT